MEILSQLNWVDILLLGICARVIFIGVNRGIVVELIKGIGTLFTVFITIHYYSGISAFLQGKASLLAELADFVSFGFLWLIMALVFKFVRDGFLILLKIETHSFLDRWGSLFISVGRALLLCSLSVLFLRLSGIEYLKSNTEKSFSGVRIAKLAPKVYESSYNGFISKFFPSEELNKAIFKVSFSERYKKDKD